MIGLDDLSERIGCLESMSLAIYDAVAYSPNDGRIYEGALCLLHESLNTLKSDIDKLEAERTMNK